MGKIKLSESELIQVIKRIVKESDDESNGLNDNFVIALRNYAKGKITKDDLYDIDDSIYYIEPKTPLGQTILTIEFKDEEELLNLLEISDDDIWFMRALNAYDGYDFMDSYQIEQDFKDGYGVYDELDDENVDKLKDLSSILLSGREFDLTSENFRIELSKILYENKSMIEEKTLLKLAYLFIVVFTLALVIFGIFVSTLFISLTEYL
jgi:hypothetical protein